MYLQCCESEFIFCFMVFNYNYFYRKLILYVKCFKLKLIIVVFLSRFFYDTLFVNLLYKYDILVISKSKPTYISRILCFLQKNPECLIKDADKKNNASDVH